MSRTDLKKQSLLRVALLISMYYPPEPGGGAVTALNRALILKKIGYTVYVICGFPSYHTLRANEERYKRKVFYLEKMGDLTLIRLRLLPLESKGYLRRLILFMNFIFLALIWMPRILSITSKTELVYALAPILFSSLVGFVYSKVTGSYFVYEVSAFWPEETVALTHRVYFIFGFFGKMLARLSYSLPDVLVVISNLAAKYIADNYPIKVQIYPMYIGVDPARYPPRSKGSSRKELISRKILSPDLENKFIVLYAGVITKITKVDNLVHAAHKLTNSQEDIAFLVIGEGEEKERLQKFRSNNMIKNLFFLPFQDESLVPYIISAADLCVVPLSSEPIYDTTVPTKFFDYLACKKPQIGICGGELAKLIRRNNIGIAVKEGDTDRLADVILTLKNSPSMLNIMADNSEKALQDFTLDTLASKLNIFLKEDIAKRERNDQIS
jgi:glycosyltransferase involved in cell wall biosynthesis